MIIGNPAEFAIQYELDEDYGGEWLFGRFCYLINNIEVGDYDLGTSLRDVMMQMKYIVFDSNKRKDISLCKLLPEQVYSVIDNAIMEDVHISSIETPARFDICIHVDTMDAWKIYLIECDLNEIFLCKHVDNNSLIYHTVEKGKFDAAIHAFYAQLEELYENEQA